MAKTRMLVGDRDAVLSAIISHKFKPLMNALESEARALAGELYDTLYDKATRAWLAKAQPGAMVESMYFQVNAGGFNLTLPFGEGRRIFATHGHRFNLPAGDLVDRIRARELRLKELNDQRNALRSKTRAAIDAFRTFDDLIAAWPEAEAIIKPLWQTAPSPSSNVPAVLLKDLSEALGLPPDLAEAA